MNTHKGTLSSDSQTSGFEERGWTAGVPRFFAVETVWAHAGLTALSKLRPDLVTDFDYARLLALCNLRHPEYRPLSDAAAREAEELLGRDVATAVARTTRAEKWTRRRYLLRRMIIPTAANGRRFIGRLATVAEASRRYEHYARSHDIAFSGVAPDSAS